MDQEQIKKGFNAGYYLAQHHPALLDKLKDAIQEKDHPYAQGLLSGSGEYAKEKTNERSHPSEEQIIESKRKELMDQLQKKPDIKKDQDLGRDR